MNDLFRFLLMRPANLPPKDDVRILDASFVKRDTVKSIAQRSARQFVAAESVVKRVEDLKNAAVASAVYDALVGGPKPLADITKLVKDRSGSALQDLAKSDAFSAEAQRLTDTLVATKLLSNSSGVDARGLAHLAQGFDAISRAAAGVNPVQLRPLVIADFRGDDQPATPSRDHEPKDQPSNPTRTHEEHAAKLKKIDAAITSLTRVPASNFAAARSEVLRSDTGAHVSGLAERVAHLETRLGEATPSAETMRVASSRVDQPWTLSSQAVSALPGDVRRTVEEAGLDLRTMSLPMVLRNLNEQRTQTMTLMSGSAISKASEMVKIGSSYWTVAGTDDWVGAPKSPLPSGHGSIKPVGVGDLLLVKQHVLRYEGGEVAHVENVLKSEHLSRDTRRLERTETTVMEETETTKEEERDNQSTERFSLKRETSETLKQDTEFKAGLSVDAKYGPFVEVKANADFGTKSSSEESTRQASEFSKDVVSRSVSKIVERVLQRRTTTTIVEFEEKYSHGFDNTAGASNISGVYQWVDKVLQAQIYNYGKRMLFDITLPEPSTAFIEAQTKSKQASTPLQKPVPFTVAANQINEGNYRYYAKLYDVTGLEAPPPPVKTVAKAFDAVVSQDPNESSKSQELSIDDGYEAKYALFQRDYRFYDGASWRVLIGSNWVDAFSAVGYVDMSGEVGTVAIAYDAYKIRNLAATVEIFCERTDRAMTAWQLKAHSAITQGYLAKEQAYESALAEAAAQAGVQIVGRNPMWNLRLITTELRKQAITLLTAQQFDAFGALELSAQGYPQPNLARTEAQMPYVRFFEQAFEWEHLIYFCYPYFWGWKPAWLNRMLLDDVDPVFADFIRAGAARVVFPVRPGFEAAVIHYLETGEIWNGGPPPDISSSMYVPIVKEIQEAQGAPGDEVPQGDPWLVRLPTTLVKLRPDDALPEWKKVGEDWQPAN